MATYATGYSTAGNVFQPHIEGLVYVREVTYALTAALALNDVIQMLPVFNGEKVVGIDLITDELDTGVDAIVLDVGDGGDVDRYIDGTTVGQAGGSASQTVATSYTYTADDTIDILVATGPGTGATSGNITLRAHIVVAA